MMMMNWVKIAGIKMVIVQLCISLSEVCYSLAANDGMNLMVLVAYSLWFGGGFSLFFVCLSCTSRSLLREFWRSLSWNSLFLLVCCGLSGEFQPQNIYVVTLSYIPPRIAAAIANANPVVSFVVGLISGKERWPLMRNRQGKRMLLGLFIVMVSVLLPPFYKGPVLLTTHLPTVTPPEFSGKSVLVCIFLSVLGCANTALWSQLKAERDSRLETYPYHHISVIFSTFIGAVPAGIYALWFDHNWESWKLSWDNRLLAVVYLGIICFGIMKAHTVRCLQTEGPEFVSKFDALGSILSTIISPIASEGKLHLGSLLTVVTIYCGAYTIQSAKKLVHDPQPQDEANSIPNDQDHHQEPEGEENIDSDQESERSNSQTSNGLSDHELETKDNTDSDLESGRSNSETSLNFGDQDDYKDIEKGYISETDNKNKSTYHQEPEGDDNVDSDEESESSNTQTSNGFGDQDDYKGIEKGYISETDSKNESTYHREPELEEMIICIEYDQESESCDR